MTEKSRPRRWRTVGEILVSCAEHRPEVTLISGPADGDLTARALLFAARRGARLLAENGIGHSDYVAIDSTSLSWAEVAIGYLAVTWLGAVAVLTAGESSELVARERVGVVATISKTVATISNTVGARTITNFTPAELLAAQPLAGLPSTAPDDVLDIVFTSGTTGTPKPVISKHSQWTGSVRPEIMTSSRRRVVAHSGIPISVSGGLHGVLLNHLARGLTSVCAPTASELVDRCRAGGVDELHVSPHAARGVGRLTAVGETWMPQISAVRVVGGPVPEALAGQLCERFPNAKIVSIYGLTEGGAAMCVKRIGRGTQDSVGRPAPGTEVRVLDPEGAVLPAGEVGELAFRVAGTAALAYHDEDFLNRDWFPQGWARTGDLGRVEPNGEVRLVGRVKELIFLRGGRLPPEYVEEILARQIAPGIEFAVVGLPSPGGWDRIAVFLGGLEDHPQIVEAQRRLAGMKGPFRPAIVRAVPVIPRGPFGKPLRRLLTDLLFAEADPG